MSEISGSIIEVFTYDRTSGIHLMQLTTFEIHLINCVAAERGVLINWTKNVKIANALQLEASRATPAHSRFYYDAMPSLNSLNLFAAV